MGHPVMHFEFWANSGEVLGQFYHQVFDWEIEKVPGMDYTMIRTGSDEGINGALMERQADMPSGITIYVEVDSLEDQIAKIEAAGGTIVVPATDIPGFGCFALFKDPEGNCIGLWQTIDVA